MANIPPAPTVARAQVSSSVLVLVLIPHSLFARNACTSGGGVGYAAPHRLGHCGGVAARSKDREPATLRPALTKEAAMARYLKRGMDAGAIKAADAQVRQTVEQILAE